MNSRFCTVCRRHYGDLAVCPTDGQALISLPMRYPTPGAHIDAGYRLDAAIAAGGMSRIYRAKELATGRPMAVKVLDPRMAVHPHTINRFYREARVSRLLNHPNVVEVTGFGPTADGHQLMVMELLGGESLGTVLQRHGALPWQRVARIGIEVCEALGHAHGRRVVHRDVKPHNLQLIGDPGPDERVKLLDFGVAYVAADAEFSQPSPGSASVSGTPAYMSPEQIRGLPLDGRSDLYALGTMMFECIAGVRPFPGSDPVEICRRQLFERPPSLRAVAPDVECPAELESVIKELLAKSPRSRVPGVGALIQRLMLILPAAEWPTRLRAAGRRSGLSPRGRVAGRIREVVTKDLQAVRPTAVTFLHVTIRGDRGHEQVGTAAWSRRVDELLAAWRGLVEQAGALVQQPEPDALRAVFGLFRATPHSEQLGDAIPHGLRLLELLAAEAARAGASLEFRGCMVQTTTTGAKTELEFDYEPSLDEGALIEAVLAATPAGELALVASGEGSLRPDADAELAYRMRELRLARSDGPVEVGTSPNAAAWIVEGPR